MEKNILIIKGGKSAEAEVSRKTAINVEKALKSKGYKTMMVEPNDDLINFLIKNKGKIDIIFNALHGSWGEDGKIQGLFEYMKIPYTHSGVSASAIGMDKFLSKNIFSHNDVMTPNGRLTNIKELKVKEPLKRPFILKPVSEGSSLGISLVKECTKIEKIFSDNILEDYLVEEYIPGHDITVGVMNGRAIGMIEVITDQEIFDYNHKYNSKKTKYIFPDNLDKEIEKKIILYSEKSFKLLNCDGIARVDFRVNINAKKNEVFILEINTQPGLTEGSLFPRIAKNAGIKFPDLIEWIINNAGLNK